MDAVIPGLYASAPETLPFDRSTGDTIYRRRIDRIVERTRKGGNH